MGTRTNKKDSNVTEIERPETQGWFNVDVRVMQDGKPVGKRLRLGGVPLTEVDNDGNELTRTKNFIKFLRENPGVELHIEYDWNDLVEEQPTEFF